MTAIEVTFLGTTAAVPTKSRNQSAIHLRYQSEEEFNLLWDCGEATQRQMLRAGVNFMRIDHIFITHWHADHFAGLLPLMQTMNLEGRKKPLKIYGPEAEKFVDILLSTGYFARAFDIIPVDVEFEGSEISTLLDATEFRVTSIPVKHGIPAVAYCLEEKDRVKIDKDKSKLFGLPEKGPIYKQIKEKGFVEFRGKTIKLEELSKIEKGKRVVYSGDTLPTKNIIKIAYGADLLIHDSTILDEDDLAYKHASLGEVINIAQQCEAKKVVLTHISRRYQDEEELLEKIKDHKNVVLAKDFMQIIV